MPPAGKKVSFTDLIGEKFDEIVFKNKKGEHQFWLINKKASWIFFYPVFCCDAITIDYISPISFETVLHKKLISLLYNNKGEMTFNFEDESKLSVYWLSKKHGKKVPLLFLSKQLANS